MFIEIKILNICRMNIIEIRRETNFFERKSGGKEENGKWTQTLLFSSVVCWKAFGG
jgi:hypothetical protein